MNHTETEQSETIYEQVQTAEHSVQDIRETAHSIADSGILALLQKDRCSVKLRRKAADQLGKLLEGCEFLAKVADEARPEETGEVETWVNSTSHFCLWLSGRGTNVNHARLFLTQQLQTLNRQGENLSERISANVRSIKQLEDSYQVSVDDEHDDMTRLTEETEELQDALVLNEDLTSLMEQVFLNHTGDVWSSTYRATKKVKQSDILTATSQLLANREQLVADPNMTWRVAIFGGQEYNNVTDIFSRLDALHKKHPTMTVYTGTAKKGTEAIVRSWCTNHNVQVFAEGFEWERKTDGSGKWKVKPAFDRNRRICDHALLHAIVVFPSSGFPTGGWWVQEALKRKIALWTPGHHIEVNNPTPDAVRRAARPSNPQHNDLPYQTR